MSKQPSLKINRINRINFIYKVYLLGLNDIEWQKELLNSHFSQPEINYLKKILLNLKMIEDKIKIFLPDDWKLERLNKLERSVLVNGVAEIFLFENNKAIVIDEAVKFCKKYTEKDSYKLINGILDNF